MDNRLWTISKNNLLTLDVDKEVKMLKEIHPQQGNGNRSKLEVPRINLGIGNTGETEMEIGRSPAHHGSLFGCQELNSVNRSRLRSPGKTETEAPESTKNSLLDKISHRNRREEQQTSSGTGARTGVGTGSGTGPSGWKGASTCQTTSFPSPSKTSCR